MPSDVLRRYTAREIVLTQIYYRMKEEERAAAEVRRKGEEAANKIREENKRAEMRGVRRRR